MGKATGEGMDEDMKRGHAHERGRGGERERERGREHDMMWACA